MKVHVCILPTFYTTVILSLNWYKIELFFEGEMFLG